MDWKLELVLLPVSDVDRECLAISSSSDSPSTFDHRAGDAFRAVQMTPPGSACSISIGIGITDAAPESV